MNDVTWQKFMFLPLPRWLYQTSGGVWFVCAGGDHAICTEKATRGRGSSAVDGAVVLAYEIYIAQIGSTNRIGVG